MTYFYFIKNRITWSYLYYNFFTYFSLEKSHIDYNEYIFPTSDATYTQIQLDSILLSYKKERLKKNNDSIHSLVIAGSVYEVVVVVT